MADRRLACRLPGLAGLLLLMAALAAGCAKPTPYQPRGSDGMGPPYGYAEQKLGEDRYRVTVSGNEATSRETVENYLMFRAAELTLAADREAFRLIERDTEPLTRYATTYLGGGIGRPMGYAFLPAPFYHPSDLDDREIHSRAITRYRSQAEIQLIERLPPEPEPDVYEARPLLTQLAPAIRRSSSLAD